MAHHCGTMYHHSAICAAIQTGRFIIYCQHSSNFFHAKALSCNLPSFDHLGRTWCLYGLCLSGLSLKINKYWDANIFACTLMTIQMQFHQCIFFFFCCAIKTLKQGCTIPNMSFLAFATMLPFSMMQNCHSIWLVKSQQLYLCWKFTKHLSTYCQTANKQ